jgi:hypothetical protein
VDDADQDVLALLSESLVKGLRVMRRRVVVLNASKKHYFQLLSHLIDKSSDAAVLMCVAETVCTWVRGDGVYPAPQLTQKEKTNFLLKMCRFERVNHPPLMSMLLDTVLQLYSLHSPPAIVIGAEHAADGSKPPGGKRRWCDCSCDVIYVMFSTLCAR